MSLDPLVAAPLVVQVHAFTAMAAFALGIIQLAGPKGTLPHRTMGYVWVGLMLLVATSSFAIHGMRQWGRFSTIHLLSVMVLVLVPLALLAARRHHVGTHRWAMIGLFAGALVIAGRDQFERALNAIYEAGLRIPDDVSIVDLIEVPEAWERPTIRSAHEDSPYEVAKLS